MKGSMLSICGAVLLAGCAKDAVKAPPPPAPNPVPALVAGRPVVYRTGCPERFRVDSGMMADFALEFPGQKPDDSAFQAFVRPAYASRISSMARLGKIVLEQASCDSARKLPGVGFSSEGVRLLLDTADLDTGKVYLARSPLVFAVADSATRAGFFGKEVSAAVKLIQAGTSFGLYDARTRRLIATGALRGLSSTGAVSGPDVVRDDWYSASKRLAGDLEKALDSLLPPDTAAKR